MSSANGEPQGAPMTFGDHLEELRGMLIRVLVVAVCVAIVIFAFKDLTFDILLAPSQWDFVTYRAIERLIHLVNPDFHFTEFHVNMIATELSSQFMTHVSTAFYLGLLFSSPFVVYELYKFVVPALYENERRYSRQLVVTVYLLFILGLLMSYYVLFPISFRFLGTYSVDARVVSNITLDSYISTFMTLSLLMGLVFQLPVVAYILAKMGIVNAGMLSRYRRHALIIIMFVAAIITPPDLMTLVLVTVPLYLLFEVSIVIIRKVQSTSD